MLRPFDRDYSLSRSSHFCIHMPPDQEVERVDSPHRLTNRKLPLTTLHRLEDTWFKAVVSPEARWAFTFAVEFVARSAVIALKCGQ